MTGKPFQWFQTDGLCVLRFDALEQNGFSHAVFARRGGVSSGPYKSLNLGANVGDDPQNVAENRLRAARALEADSLVMVRQVHGRRVLAIRREDPVQAGVWPTGEKADALITDVPGVFCSVKVADCQPILLADPQKNVVAACHSGWRGSVENIAAATVSAMTETFGCLPADLVACVGPSLGPCCAEFVNYRTELPESFLPFAAGQNRFDFWAITRSQLEGAGLASRNIHVAGICTRCDQENFFSFRRDRTTGRNMAAIGVRAKAGG
ncbi:MAG: peptidoglycan editing factor PgeF [Thermodesulfobacteriota bacterium]